MWKKLLANGLSLFKGALPYLYGAAAGLVIGAIAAWYVTDEIAEGREARAIAQAIGAVVAIERGQHDADMATVLGSLEQSRRNEEKHRDIQHQLDKTIVDLEQCRVSRDAVGLLNRAAGVPEAPRHTGELPKASATPDASCADVARSAAKNYEICEQNADDYNRVMRWYEDMKQRYNKGLE